MITYIKPEEIGEDKDLCNSVARICNKIATETWYDGYNNALLDVTDFLDKMIDEDWNDDQLYALCKFKEIIEAKLKEDD